MQKGIEYKGLLLMPGSEAYEMYNSKDEKIRKKLDKHLKELEQKNKDLTDRYKWEQNGKFC